MIVETKRRVVAAWAAARRRMTALASEVVRADLDDALDRLAVRNEELHVAQRDAGVHLAALRSWIELTGCDTPADARDTIAALKGRLAEIVALKRRLADRDHEVVVLLNKIAAMDFAAARNRKVVAAPVEKEPEKTEFDVVIAGIEDDFNRRAAGPSPFHGPLPGADAESVDHG